MQFSSSWRSSSAVCTAMKCLIACWKPASSCVAKGWSIRTVSHVATCGSDSVGEIHPYMNWMIAYTGIDFVHHCETVRYNVPKFKLGEDGRNDLMFRCDCATQSPFDGLCCNFYGCRTRNDNIMRCPVQFHMTDPTGTFGALRLSDNLRGTFTW
jgi:hypothetical protein